MEENEVAQKFGIDLEALRHEQLKIAKNLEIKDIIDFSLAKSFGAIENIIINNQIISAVIVCDTNFEIIEEQYFLDKLRFPYIFEFRSYRELPAMLECFNKLQNKPDLVFIHGAGIMHPRLGLASHFSLSTGIPCIGVNDFLFKENTIVKDDILLGNKKVGRVLKSKEKSNPLYVSVGDRISSNSAYELAKKMVIVPHKLPEPMHFAHKYARNVRKELKI